MKNKRLVSIIIALIVFAVFGAGSYLFGDEILDSKNINSNLQTENTIVVNYLDVGQGDSEFIQLPNGKCMLIDASTSNYGTAIANRITALGYTKIDYLVATHPHADHIGGMKQIVESFDIGEIYMPMVSTNTQTYENLLQAISDKGLSIKTAKAGTVVLDEDELRIEMLAPVNSAYNGLNNYSAVIKIKYGDTVFLFMGDAEMLSESEIMSTYSKEDLKADVLKVGHHGSNTASMPEFINAVSPKYAVIEVGEGNSYNHPHAEALEALDNAGAKVYRTDIKGNISVVSDKTDLKVYKEKG